MYDALKIHTKGMYFDFFSKLLCEIQHILYTKILNFSECRPQKCKKKQRRLNLRKFCRRDYGM